MCLFAISLHCHSSLTLIETAVVQSIHLALYHVIPISIYMVLSNGFMHRLCHVEIGVREEYKDFTQKQKSLCVVVLCHVFVTP